MPRLLVLLNFTAVIALTVAGLLGFGGGADTGHFAHMYWGVATVLLGLLGQSLVIFHFMGAARFVRDVCREDRTAWPQIAAARGLRRKMGMRAFWVCSMLILQPVSGAAVYVKRLAPGWHQFGFWVTLAVLIWGLYGILRSLGRLHELLSAVRAATPSSGATA